MGDHNAAACCCGNFLIIVAIVGIGLFGGSFKTLSPLESGLKINAISQSVQSDKVYTSGRYFVGVGNNFIVYPTTLQTISFSDADGADAPPLRASTSEGQTITLEVSLQYRLVISNLTLLYRKYESSYQSKYVTVAEAAMKNTVSQRYSTQDYFSQRAGIGDVMHTALNAVFINEYAVVEHFQLREITAIAATDASIVGNQVADQNTQTVIYGAQANNTLLAIDAVLAGAQLQVNVINADAASLSRILVAQAQADAIRLVTETQAEQYGRLKQSLNYTSTDLLTHLFIENMRQLGGSAQIAVDTQTALVDLSS